MAISIFYNTIFNIVYRNIFKNKNFKHLGKWNYSLEFWRNILMFKQTFESYRVPRLQLPRKHLNEGFILDFFSYFIYLLLAALGLSCSMLGFLIFLGACGIFSCLACKLLAVAWLLSCGMWEKGAVTQQRPRHLCESKVCELWVGGDCWLRFLDLWKEMTYLLLSST